MRKLIVLVSVLFLTTGVAYAKDFEVNKKVGEYALQMKIDRNPPIVGDNNVEVGIKDASGKSVTDAKVVVNYSMPAMPACLR